MAEVFVHFSKPNRRIAALKKRNVITSTAIPITPVDHHSINCRNVSLSLLFDEARELPGSRIVFSTNAATRSCFGLSFVRRNSFGEDTHCCSIAYAVAAECVANNVVGEHRIDV